ncbi:MAG: hypothetical protein ACK5H1_03255 [Tenacibaculum sp.]
MRLKLGPTLLLIIRGASEKLFDIQNNDFNWNAMPHIFLDQNNVYLIIISIAHIVYKWLLSIFSEIITDLNPKAIYI